MEIFFKVLLLSENLFFRKTDSEKYPITLLEPSMICTSSIIYSWYCIIFPRDSSCLKLVFFLYNFTHTQKRTNILFRNSHPECIFKKWLRKSCSSFPNHRSSRFSRKMQAYKLPWHLIFIEVDCSCITQFGQKKY